MYNLKRTQKMLQYLKELRKKYKTIYWIVLLKFVMKK
ncbi:unnamed protein product [Acanthoscelides obtectus]|uniref:Uncharacterized protein n=1 Tax=Acanthoscelides obtectus TaxID=200917 RepID=A0A9P0LGV3_ACAOB|nr:unnamed protein product [Acanthoscelides obtectus]CAK1660027.1 hypothetical protein AOBTE_LOCUS21826 [Acanthoscelides obtectus]